MLRRGRHGEHSESTKERLEEKEGSIALDFLRWLPFIGTLTNHPLNEVREEAEALAKTASPIILTSLLILSRTIISMIFLRNLDAVELAGGALALRFGNITGNSILKGLAMGMDPICSQAFGARRWPVLAQTFLKTLVLLFLACIPISILWLNLEFLLLGLRLGHDTGIAKIAQAYMTFSIPELFAQALFHPLRTFLRTQGLTAPITLACLFALALHIPVNYFLVVYMGLRVKGVALALSLNTIILNLVLVIYMSISKTPVKPWRYGASPIFRDCKQLLSLATTSCISVCSEWWWYEIMFFLCGLLGDDSKISVKAMAIMIQISGFLYSVPFSLSSAVSARIGNALGAGQPSRGEIIAGIGVAASIVFSMFASILMTVLRSTWMRRLYSDEPQVLGIVISALPILGLCEIGNSPKTVASGILTGTARPASIARINLFSFYIIGIPMALLMAFKFEFGFKGLWLGLLVSQMSSACMVMHESIWTNWEERATRAEKLTLAEARKFE